uniref:Uncharacterized protein n=1 Tax=Cyanoderma ruficeps TaxID=181631 RepID=A0A8C3NVJ1_9PASS
CPGEGKEDPKRPWVHRAAALAQTSRSFSPSVEPGQVQLRPGATPALGGVHQGGSEQPGEGAQAWLWRPRLLMGSGISFPQPGQHQPLLPPKASSQHLSSALRDSLTFPVIFWISFR